MGVKYILQFKSASDISWQCNIETDSYNAAPIFIHGKNESALQISYDGDSVDDPFNVLIKSELTLNFYQEGQVDVDELQHAADKDFVAKVFRNGQLRWVGFLKPEDIQQPLASAPYELNISFICGLAMLEKIPYVHNDLQGVDGTVSRCPMNYIRNILFTNLGIRLPVRWSNQIQCTAFSNDFFTGGVTWSPFNEGFYTYQQGNAGDQAGPLQNCAYILEGILKSVQCRIYQSKGKWIIRRVNDVIAGTVKYSEIPGSLGKLTVISGTDVLLKKIGRAGYNFINENALLTVKQGIKSFKTTYTANIRSNIVPNGNMDIVSAVDDFLYWGIYGGAVVIDDVPSLDGRSGAAVKIVSALSDDVYFSMVSPGSTLGKDGLPVDAYTLVKVINFSFLFSPLYGFPVTEFGGPIVWDSKPFRIQIILNQGAHIYYLTEFGTWTSVETDISIVVDQLKIGDVARIAFDKFQGVKLPQPDTQPVAGDTCDIQIIFRVGPNQGYALDNIAISIENSNDVYEVFDDSNKNTSTDEAELTISSSFGGYMLSNFMSGWYNSDSECFFNDGLVYTGTLTGLHSHAVMRYRYKSSQIFNGDINIKNNDWCFDEIYSIDTLLGKKFLPLNAKYYVDRGIVNIIAMESRNDNITLRQSFYNSNDNQTSN